MKIGNIVNSKKTIAITLLLLLSISSMIALVPNATASLDITTYPFMTVVPSIVGVGQQAQITMWLSAPPPTLLEQGAGKSQGWHNFTVTVTKPDGTSETLGPFTTESTGSTYTLYNPSMVGNYTFQMSFAGELKNGTDLYTRAAVDNYYKPSVTSVKTLTVQEDPINSYPDWPLPTEYWTRPINSENRLWGSIGGNWLLERYSSTGNVFAPYTTAPNTAHIIWTKELAFGGVTGGDFEGKSYQDGHTYNNKFNPPVIINGRLYYNQPDLPTQGFYCVDLRTGEQLFYSNASSNPTGAAVFWDSRGGTGGISCGQLINFDGINEHGLHAYLWNLGSIYTLFDAFTGNVICNFNNVPSGATYYPAINYDENGNMLIYVLDSANDRLLMWNSTKALFPQGSDSFMNNMARVSGTLDWSRGIQWNVTIPHIQGQGWMTDNPGAAAINDEVLLATTWSFFSGPADGKITDIAYSATDGHVLWIQNRTVPAEETSFAARGPISDGVYCRFIKATKQWYAYDITTGNLKWGPSEAYTNDWGMYQQAGATSAYGVLYAAAYDGMIHAYNITTGAHLWDFWAGDAGKETPYGTWPFYGLTSALTIADGKLYTGTGDHSSDNPLWRGGGLYCVNATTGDLEWKISGFYWTPIIADGYMVVNNGADNRIYCFGKGQTATTVTASPEVSVQGTSVLIKGTVLDQSPGAKNTAAIADEYQTPWMEYLYMQRPKPTNATGISVNLNVIDANGNYRTIGSTISDADGFFSYNWMPDIEGKYTVYASFEGSESYWPSHAVTAFNVDPAPATPTPQPTQAPSMADQYFIPMSSAIIVLIIVVAAVLLLALRKRP